MRIRPECARLRAAVGAKAVIHGLQQAAEFNGRVVGVQGFEEATGRYILRLFGFVEKSEATEASASSDHKRLRAEELCQAAPGEYNEASTKRSCGDAAAQVV
jgi:hypothetical protein